MDTAKIREAFLNAPEKMEDVTIPDWLASLVDEDTQLALRDIPGDTFSLLQKQAHKDANLGDIQLGAALICHCLINKATGEPVFQSTDRDTVTKLGSGKLTPLAAQITTFLGFMPVKKGE